MTSFIDKAEIIKNKINAFFKTKASFKNRIRFEDLQLYVDIKNEDQLNVYLYDGARLMGEIELKAVLNLSMLEKAFTSEESVSATLYSTIVNFAKEMQVDKSILQLLIRSTGEYFVCINRNVDHKITINQIIS